MKKAFVLVACLLLSVFFVNAQNNVINAELQKVLNQRNDDYIDVNIMFKSQMQTENLSSFYCKSDSKEVRREIVINELKKFAEQSQKDVLSVIKAEERSKDVVDVKTYWIANFINCKAKADVIYKLASHPDVALITYNTEMDTEGMMSNGESRGVQASTGKIADHVTQIKADKAWDLGYTGKGVIVAVLDSGTNLDHADIKDHLWNDNGKYGYNVHSPNSLPSDEGSNGHGSHCAGIVCGDGTSGQMTGVAPDATLMTIKIIGGGRCTAANLVEGVQKAAELGADILSLSVGRENPDENRALFRQTFTNLLQSGVVAAVAAGNDGNQTTNPAPDNVRTPGDCPPPWISPDQQGNAGGLTSVISVGAVNENNVVSPSSSKGPVTWQSISGYNDYPYNPGIGLIRPDIAAPGENVYSIRHDANDTYWGKSGTSQAAPCVAGVMALMLEKNPDLTPADLCRIIETTAVKLTATKSNSTGAGLLDALAAVQAVDFNTTGPVLNPYAFTKTLNAGSNVNLELTLINNGGGATSGNTTVTISENDTYATIVEGSKTYSTMAAGTTASATFVVNVDPLVEDNHTVTFTVTATNGNYSHTFNLDVNIDNEFVAPSLTAQANGRDINLTWNATNNATSYNIYRNGAFLANTTSTSYTDAGLEYGTLYAYTVTSKRGELESEHSLVARAQTEDNPDKPSPTNVKANNGVVTWTNGANSKGSNVYRKDVNTSVETNIATNVNGASYTDNNWNSLADGVYQYGVANTYSTKETIYTEDFTNLTLTTTAGGAYPTMNMYWYSYYEGYNYQWTLASSINNGPVGNELTFSSFSGNSAFIKSNYTSNSYLSYLVTRPMDYTQYNGKDVKLSFYYITPSWSGSINTLKVMISTTSYNSGWTELWSSNKTDVQEWTEQVVDLSAYVGQQFYIAFVNVAGYGYCTGVDEVSVAVEGNSESRIEWSDNVYKGVNIFVNDGLWSNTDNWSAKRLPNDNDTQVIIDANATIASGDVTVNTLIINEGKSLTLNAGTSLTVNNDFVNADADAFIINDGAQVFQNNDDVAATFVMNIFNPSEWAENNKEGWQFIASPMKDAKIDDFVPASSDYDLYKYDGTKNLEWLNHKDDNTYEPEPVVPDAPQNLVATATGPYSIALTWNAVDGATRYKIYRDSNLIASYVNNPSYSSEGLTQATTYCYTVVAVNENGESAESNEACATTDLAIPTAPQNVVAEAASSSSITLTWNVVAGAATYNIYLADALVASGITATEHTIEGLASQSTYCYTVTAVNALGESPKSTAACATTPMAMPDVPQNLVATAAGSSVELTWSVAAGAASYNVYDDNGLVVSGITSANHTIYDLEAGEHCFTVTAVNAAGESARSAQACATTTAQDPDAPIVENVIIGDGNSTTGALPIYSACAYSISQQIYTRAEIGQTGNIKSVSFKYKSGLTASCTRTVKVYLKHTAKELFTGTTDWVSMTDDDLVYNGDITVNAVADEWVRIKLDEPFEYKGNNLVVCVYDYTGTANDQITFAADEISEAKSLYYYSLYSASSLDPSNVNKTGYIPSPVKRNQIRFSFVTGNEPAIPAAPSNLMATCSQELNIIEAGENDIYEYANAITLTWNADNTAESYNIYDEGGNKIGQTGGNTFTIDGLETATRYCFSVSAVNETGEGATAEVCTTTITEVPQNLVARSTDATTINLSWDAVVGATSYRAYLGGQLVATDITTTSCDITGLVTGNYYCYSVAAVNEGGESFKSVLACAEAGDIQLEMCNIIFTLYDLPWGDGWRQGSKITVSYGESSVDFKTPTYDAETSAYKETYHTLSIPKGTEVTVTYTRGANEFAGYYENSFDVKCENGTVLLVTNAEELLGGETFTFVADCTPKAPNAPVLTANATSSSSIALSWNEVATATSYNVYQGENKIATVATISYNVEGLSANTEYCFTVKAVNEVGESEASNEACEMTLLATPTNLVATANGENTIVLTWDAVAGATSYKIYSGETAIATVTETTYTKELLIAGTEYCYSVSAVNEDGESAKTTPACATTDEAAPEELCTVIFTLEDKYTDGWVGTTAGLYNCLLVEYNGNSIEYTLGIGSKTVEYTLEIPQGTNVDVTYYGREWAIENSFVIKYEDGTEIINVAQGTLTNTTITYPSFTVNCSSETPDNPETPETPEVPEGTPTTFLYSFDDGNLDAFTLIDEDGDGNNWELLQNAVASYSWKSGIGAFTPKNYIYTNEIYTITTTSKLMYRVTDGGYPDKYAVVISEDGNTFEIVFEETTSTSTFTPKEIDLSAYAGRVVHFGLLHYDCTDKYYVRIDDFQLTDGSAKSSSANKTSEKMTDLKAGFEKANSVTYSGTELSKFEPTFQQGVGYLASYQTETTATFKGTLNHENSFTFNVRYDTGKDLANFHLLGNPFAFDMKWNNVNVSNVIDGYAVVNENGGYEYATSGEIKVGDGFFVKATGANPTMSYNTRNRNAKKETSLNVVAAGKNGKDNVVVRLDENQEGFPKINNFNENIALVYVLENDMPYGIYNYSEDVQEVELVFIAAHIGEYNIHIEPNGEFEYVTLVDKVNDRETNMMTSSYTFTTTPKENGNRFLLRFAKDKGSAEQGKFVFQSGNELVIEAEGMVQIIDVMGRVVYSNDVTSENNRIDTSKFNTAAYIVRLINGNGVKTQKIVVM